MRRTASALLVLSMVVLAGCSASVPGANDEQTGTVRLYVSDERNAIDQFSSLNVTVTGVAFETAEDGPVGTATASANGSTDASALATTTATTTDGAWERHDVDDVTVDLTHLRGENATRLGNLSVTSGDYSGVRLGIGTVEGTLTDGEQVSVRLPSDRLRLNDQFAVETGDDVEFVFDVTVVGAGTSGQFVLRPVASESGTDRSVELVDASVDTGGGAAGVDLDANVPVGSNRSGATVDADDESTNVDLGTGMGPNGSDGLELHVVGTPAPGETVAVEVTRDDVPVIDAQVLLDGATVGETNAEGSLDVTLPTSGTTTLRVEHGSASVDAELVFG